MKTSKLLALLLALVVAFSLVACGPKTPVDTGSSSTGNEEFDLVYAEGTTLRMATGYNSAKTGTAFDADTAGEGITLANGKTYHTGDLKPTWETLEGLLKVNFEDKYQGNNASKEWAAWENRLEEVDMVSGTASALIC